MAERSLAKALGISARGSYAVQTPQFVGDLTAGVPPVPIPNTEVKPRRADGTARESVWERRSLPALNKGHIRKECGLCLLWDQCEICVWTRSEERRVGDEWRCQELIV